jgi:hypothetical protein
MRQQQLTRTRTGRSSNREHKKILPGGCFSGKESKDRKLTEIGMDKITNWVGKNLPTPAVRVFDWQDKLELNQLRQLPQSTYTL